MNLISIILFLCLISKKPNVLNLQYKDLPELTPLEALKGGGANNKFCVSCIFGPPRFISNNAP